VVDDDGATFFVEQDQTSASSVKNAALTELRNEIAAMRTEVRRGRAP
jgi:hypothetical protein